MDFIQETGKFMGELQWLMRIEGALAAHFIQADGSSRPGTDWAVGLQNGDATYKVFVRAYLSDDITPQAKADQEYQAKTVMGYLNDLIMQGWQPDHPRELVIVIQNPTGVSTPPKKSRWRLW
ncbi:MAG: hypothetical protein ABI970_23890 [Chloroflexota bacterium]